MRCNVGINPLHLSDQHLIAEYRELFIVLGQLKKQNYILPKNIPNKFTLNGGHINFFKNKLLYLKKRHILICCEMRRRQFKTNLQFELPGIKELENDWSPNDNDSNIIKERILDRVSKKPEWYKYKGKTYDIYPLISNKTYFV